MTEKEKQKQLIKKIVTENFSCSYCKELGMFDDCNSKKKSCEQILSDCSMKLWSMEKAKRKKNIIRLWKSNITKESE